MSSIFSLIVPRALAFDINIGVAPENAHFLWLTPIFGMIMIFTILSILWGVLSLFKVIFAGQNKSEAKPEAPKAAPMPKAEPKPAPMVAPAPTATDDAELIAVLTAAIAAYEAEQNPDATPANFRVVSYRRTNGGRSWNAK